MTKTTKTMIPLELSPESLVEAAGSCVDDAMGRQHSGDFRAAARRYDLAAYFFRLAGHDALAQRNAAKAAKCRGRIPVLDRPD